MNHPYIPIGTGLDRIYGYAVMSRIKHLEEGVGLPSVETNELAELKLLADQAKNYEGWEEGEIIHRACFVEFAKDHAVDNMPMLADPDWPLNHIDWVEAARQLEQNYASLYFDGQEYLLKNELET